MLSLAQFLQSTRSRLDAPDGFKHELLIRRDERPICVDLQIRGCHPIAVVAELQAGCVRSPMTRECGEDCARRHAKVPFLTVPTRVASVCCGRLTLCWYLARGNSMAETMLGTLLSLDLRDSPASIGSGFAPSVDAALMRRHSPTEL